MADNTPLHTEDAYDHLVRYLAQIPEPRQGQRPPHNQRPYGCDIWIPEVAWNYWHGRTPNIHSHSDLLDDHFQPFYDVAWELCRIGVLRPGHVVARGQAMGTGFAGDGYSLTAFGRQWLKDTSRPPA